jgi:hypothetical protein
MLHASEFAQNPLTMYENYIKPYLDKTFGDDAIKRAAFLGQLGGAQRQIGPVLKGAAARDHNVDADTSKKIADKLCWFGVVVTTHRGRLPSRSVIWNMSQHICALFHEASSSHQARS